MHVNGNMHQDDLIHKVFMIKCFSLQGEITMLNYILAVAVAYLFGSVPWGLFIGLVFFHKDLRKEGSGNTGGTNAGRVLGRPIGVLVVVLDALKALISVATAHYLAPGCEVYAGLACCFGHCFPIFTKFQGGKAVATSYGYFLALALFVTHDWLASFVLPVVCFFGILFFSRMVSFSSMLALWINAIVSTLLYFFNAGSLRVSLPLSLIILSIFVTYRHRSNIERIIAGSESRIKWMGKAPWEK